MKTNKSYKGWLALSAVVALFSTASVRLRRRQAPAGWEYTADRKE